MTNSRVLPEGVKPYHSQSFTAGSLPAKLTERHSTKAGVWGRIYVRAGRVSYFVPGRSEPVAVLSVGQSFIVLPQEIHFVRVTDDAQFQLEFCRHLRTVTDDDGDPHQ